MARLCNLDSEISARNWGKLRFLFCPPVVRCPVNTVQLETEEPEVRTNHGSGQQTALLAGWGIFSPTMQDEPSLTEEQTPGMGETWLKASVA